MTDTLLKEIYNLSKNQLIEATTRPSRTIIEYTVQKYCSLPAFYGDEMHELPLKPKNKIIIEWVKGGHGLLGNLSSDAYFPKTITVEGQTMTTAWSLDKFQRWLNRNTAHGGLYTASK